MEETDLTPAGQGWNTKRQGQGEERKGKQRAGLGFFWCYFLDVTLIWPPITLPFMSTNRSQTCCFRSFLFQSVIIDITRKWKLSSIFLLKEWWTKSHGFYSYLLCLFFWNWQFYSMTSNGFLMTHDCSFQAWQSRQSVKATPAASDTTKGNWTAFFSTKIALPTATSFSTISEFQKDIHLQAHQQMHIARRVSTRW